MTSVHSLHSSSAAHAATVIGNAISPESGWADSEAGSDARGWGGVAISPESGWADSEAGSDARGWGGVTDIESSSAALITILQ